MARHRERKVGSELNVLIVHGYGLEGSGSSIYTRNLANSLLAEGHRVLVLGHSNDSDEGAVKEFAGRGGIFERLPQHTLAVTYPRAEFYGAPLVRDLPLDELRAKSHAVTARILEVGAAFAPDLIIANHFLHIAHGAVQAAGELGAASVVVSHGTDMEYACAFSDAAKTLAQETFAKVTTPVALNLIARDRIAELLEVSTSKIAVVAPGIDIQTFIPDVTPSRPERIVQVGRVLLDKGPQITIAAVCLALEEFPDLELVLVGDGPDRKGLEALVGHLDAGDVAQARRTLVNLGTSAERARLLAPVAHALFGLRGRERLGSLQGRLRKAIRFAGYCDATEVAATFRTARLAVLPSLMPECYPLTLLEAMSSGCFIQASPLGGTKEILQRIASTDISAVASRVMHPERPVLSLLNGIRSAIPEWNADTGLRLAAMVREQHDWRNISVQLGHLPFNPITARVSGL